DVAAATRQDIRVASVPAYSTEAVAEQTFALMFAVARHIVPADSSVRGGQFQTDGTDPGLGRIGTRVASRRVLAGAPSPRRRQKGLCHGLKGFERFATSAMARELRPAGSIEAFWMRLAQ